MQNKTLFSIAALSVMGMTSIASAARQSNDHCAPTPPAACGPDDCCTVHCLGPDNYGVNAPVRPMTCNGDWMFTVAGLYWVAHEDGLEYATNSQVENTSDSSRANLIDAKYLNPHFKWNFGFKLGLGYNTTHDGWDVGVLWTRFNGKASSHVESEADDNNTLTPLWSNAQATQLYATDIETSWNLNLDLIDIDLGREFWVSKYVSLRPHMGVRIGFIKQNYEIKNKGGSWTDGVTTTLSTPLNNLIDLDNDFKGVGVRGGLESIWNIGCGWAFYGDFAVSILYGRFNIDHNEKNKEATTPFTKGTVMQEEESFRVSRMITDLALGIEWSTGFCDNRYGFTAQLGWEQHIFLDQNQLWRVRRVNGDENVFQQRRGDLDTAGWTLNFRFEF